MSVKCLVALSCSLEHWILILAWRGLEELLWNFCRRRKNPSTQSIITKSWPVHSCTVPLWGWFPILSYPVHSRSALLGDTPTALSLCMEPETGAKDLDMGIQRWTQKVYLWELTALFVWGLWGKVVLVFVCAALCWSHGAVRMELAAEVRPWELTDQFEEELHSLA